MIQIDRRQHGLDGFRADFGGEGVLAEFVDRLLILHGARGPVHRETSLS